MDKRRIDWNDKWIIGNYSKYPSYKSMAEDYSRLFGRNISASGLKIRARKLGIKKPKWYEEYTNEQISFIKEFYPEHGVESTVVAFNKRFGTNRSKRSIKNTAFRLSIQVKKDISSKNKRAAIDNGHGKRAAVPVGTIREECGRPVIKTECGWESYGRAMYKGQIPKGHVVTHLDGDLYNVNESNLMAIPVQYMGLLLKNNLRSSNADITRTGIMWCELYSLLQKEQDLKGEKSNGHDY